jgi:beta-mannosidase
MFRQTLDGTWWLRWASRDDPQVEHWRGGFPDGVLASVPGDVHSDLVTAGRLGEPLLDTAARDAAWVGDYDWWYSRTFEVSSLQGVEQSELHFDGIDLSAQAWLNGQALGSHSNAHLPWTIDISDQVREGANVLVVRVDDGFRSVAGRDFARYDGLSSHHGGVPMMLMRKPLFTHGWDWAPVLPTCGIYRDVELRLLSGPVIRRAAWRTRLQDDGGAVVSVHVEVENPLPTPQTTTLRVTLDDHSVELTSALGPGDGTLAVDLQIEDPRLWWPAPLGAPTLCTSSVELVVSGRVVDVQRGRQGLREVELRQQPLGDGEGESFTIVVNGVPVFAKGAGWQPADQLIARASDTKIRELVRLAAQANLNMLRIWGGGVYERDAFYDACDDFGVLVWQDFLYACSYYPDDDPEFVAQAREEAAAAVRRLRNHPSLALWCGNNETQWMHGAKRARGETRPHYGLRLYDEVLPAVVAEHDPTRPYWPGTPTGGSAPNAPDGGTRHTWDLVFQAESLDARTDFRSFTQDTSSFVAEFGCLAPSSVSSLQAFLGPEHLNRKSDGWEFHDNWFEQGATAHAITRYWADAETLALPEYVAVGQLIQAQALTTGLDHWRRRKFRTSGALFWGYTDTWGTTHSWAIVDYFLDRRPSYHHVRRSCAPVALSVESHDGAHALWAVNDLRSHVEAVLESGVLDLASGEYLRRESRPVTLEPNAAIMLEAVGVGGDDVLTFGRLRTGDELIAHVTALAAGFEFRAVPFPAPRFTQSVTGEQLVISADTFVWQVEIDAPPGVEVSDNYFDVLPGETREIQLDGPAALLQHVTARPFIRTDT